MHFLTHVLAILHTKPFPFMDIHMIYCLIYNPPVFFVLTENGSSFAPKRLIKFFVKDFFNSSHKGFVVKDFW